MDDRADYCSTAELDRGLPDVEASPRDGASLVAIVVRPEANQRQRLTSAQLSPEGGVEGDRWIRDSYYRQEDGSPDPRNQVSLMNARLLRLLAGREEAMCLAGDNLIVDLDLSEENLPVGSRLAIGDVVIELSDVPHTGCSKFSHRYGQEARTFVNSPRGKELHLRGRYGQIVAGGTIHVGEAVRKLAPD